MTDFRSFRPQRCPHFVLGRCEHSCSRQARYACGLDPPHKPTLLSSVLIGFFGGNSTKATSGINGALTRTQVDSKITDSVQQFYEDTLKSARDKARPDLIKVLTYKSAAAVEWLQDVFGLDLTLVSRLGYASPTHRRQSKC